jgi:hypothetical protein
LQAVYRVPPGLIDGGSLLTVVAGEVVQGAGEFAGLE